MPMYEYQCADCGARDGRIAGLDDGTALCVKCGGQMHRLDKDIFAPYGIDCHPVLRRRMNRKYD